MSAGVLSFAVVSESLSSALLSQSICSLLRLRETGLAGLVVVSALDGFLGLDAVCCC